MMLITTDQKLSKKKKMAVSDKKLDINKDFENE